MQADASRVNRKFIENKCFAWALPILVIVSFGSLLYYRVWIWNPLPRDEQMIEHFQLHRVDFEEAVRRYREYPRTPEKDTSLWFKQGDTLEVFKRAGIDHINYLIPTWMPNPYTVETAILSDRVVDELGGAAIFPKYNSLGITPATTPRIDHPNTMDDSGYRRFSFRFGHLWKRYYFTPEAPHVENGEMLWPLQTVGKGFPGATFHDREGVATSQSSSQVFSTLNRFPKGWNGVNCIYRQIEPQWFLQICAGRAGIS